MRLTHVVLLLSTLAVGCLGQSAKPDRSLTGTVTLKEARLPVRNAAVTLAELKRTTLTDENGAYEFKQIPPGRYVLIIHVDRMADAVKTVEIKNERTRADIELTINVISEQVTVTASGSVESVNNSYQSVTSIGAVALAEKNTVSVGEALDYQSGVAKRSFGPGAGRPVIRGFDGDRVLVLQDGLRIGGIASQSGDEVEPIDIVSLDRIEIVKGPATLLYGSNAIGGVVNGISGNRVYQPGISGYLTTFVGTNNWQAGASGGFKYGFRHFLFFANSGAQKANDYRTAAATVANSFAKSSTMEAGAGWFAHRGWLIVDYRDDRRRHGIPVTPGAIDLESLAEHRKGYEIKAGFHDLRGLIESADVGISFNNYHAREFEFESDLGTSRLESLATNKNFNYRVSVNHRRSGKFSGVLGLSGFTRDYEAIGVEAPAPRTRQNSFAVYGLERFDLEHVGFQFGGRIEQNSYDPAGGLPNRSFLGFSGGAGLRVPLWAGGSFVANFQHSFRAPALEELYDNGPHPGILVFDIGDPNLRAEKGDGIDISLRHNTGKLRLDASVYYYNIRDFVYTAYTGSVDPASNLPIIEYAQSTSRYVGAEASIDAKLTDRLWFKVRFDHVRADLTALNKPLPRIPPMRATLGFDWSYKALSLRPEIILAATQRRIFDHETPTSGYALANLYASYTFFSGRKANVVSISGYNLTNVLYRNHLSFLKNIAPEIGRGVRANYSVRF